MLGVSWGAGHLGQKPKVITEEFISDQKVNAEVPG